MNLLGRTVTDSITGFTGVVTGYVQYITGCNQGLVVPKVSENGALIEAEWVDEQRLVVNEKAGVVDLPHPEDSAVAAVGFDKEAPKR